MNVCAVEGCGRSPGASALFCDYHLVQSAPRAYARCCQQGCPKDTLPGAAYCMEHLVKFQTPEKEADHRLVLLFVRMQQVRSNAEDLASMLWAADDAMFEALVGAINEIRKQDDDRAAN